MNRLFDDLDTSPAQEREVNAAAEDLQAAAQTFGSDLKSSLRQISDVLRSDDFDHEAVAEAWVTQDRALEEFRVSALNSLQSLHASLEPDQRARLARALERKGL